MPSRTSLVISTPRIQNSLVARIACCPPWSGTASCAYDKIPLSEIGGSRRPDPQCLRQIAGRTGLPRSSVHRILKQLHSAGLLQHRPGGYALSGHRPARAAEPRATKTACRPPAVRTAPPRPARRPS
ncbi:MULTISPECIES: helix-turn-helix domain-containing protein [unclassified Mycolicibacterium]|uniref:helix-turn-helix domain-containing protein n=1 Tax=unclassified Mycolicibacterium TaxID=2636767 RepID=UPI0012DF3EF5|nr:MULTISPECIES: helix-turn-helix domain-containing protein [unclassified Mycolicibacterium]MUL80274.1 helix-turn-helix domain-containing protein [Mycolicibacterium sp. CBMA 329]MUL86041.1 helix-turn-helix domain-containing protein [Mycolicibacterium sp. CBMA 331]MUM00815.1 helix-turn-helix domain-containing protein [Mycolicibacterium sp. CBMA 334]MUM28236.1 helix-turn-helix domain-containing protein [Mycolicibacterium sp. CBMA 295]MUM36337.1 helix-turn-helix domain-containing protein [Mycolic